MYNMFPYIISVVFLLLGIYIIVNPTKATKEEFRNDPKKVSKTKNGGFIMILAAVVMLMIGIFMPK